MSTPTRRTLLAGAGAVGLTTALSGCATYGLDTASAGSGGGSDSGSGSGSGSPDGAAGGSADRTGTGASDTAGANGDGPNGAATFARTTDIPVGGGKVFPDRKLVVTQPTAGTFRCFTAVCTHAGCVVGEVANGTINCPCHGSRFKVADGAVAAGPAKKALAAIAIKVTGDAIAKA